MIDKLPVINVTNVDRPLLQLLVDEVNSSTSMLIILTMSGTVVSHLR